MIITGRPGVPFIPVRVPEPSRSTDSKNRSQYPLRVRCPVRPAGPSLISSARETPRDVDAGVRKYWIRQRRPSPEMAKSGRSVRPVGPERRDAPLRVCDSHSFALSRRVHPRRVLSWPSSVQHPPFSYVPPLHPPVRPPLYTHIRPVAISRSEACSWHTKEPLTVSPGDRRTFESATSSAKSNSSCINDAPATTVEIHRRRRKRQCTVVCARWNCMR